MVDTKARYLFTIYQSFIFMWYFLSFTVSCTLLGHKLILYQKLILFATCDSIAYTTVGVQFVRFSLSILSTFKEKRCLAIRQNRFLKKHTKYNNYFRGRVTIITYISSIMFSSICHKKRSLSASIWSCVGSMSQSWVWVHYYIILPSNHHTYAMKRFLIYILFRLRFKFLQCRCCYKHCESFFSSVTYIHILSLWLVVFKI